MSDNSAEKINAEQRRLSTVLLGFAAAAIAFGMHEVAGWPLSRAAIFAAGAGLAWAISFIAGIQWAQKQIGSMILNLALNMIDDQHPRHAEAKQKFDAHRKAAATRYKFQFWGLLAGAALFAVATGLHMAEGAASAP